jgi:chitodextrinase
MGKRRELSQAWPQAIYAFLDPVRRVSIEVIGICVMRMKKIRPTIGLVLSSLVLICAAVCQMSGANPISHEVILSDGANSVSNIDAATPISNLADNLSTAAGFPIVDFRKSIVLGSPSSEAYEVRFVASGETIRYTLERSSNLVSWTPVAVIEAGSNQPVVLHDIAPLPSRGFYRIRTGSPVSGGSVVTANVVNPYVANATSFNGTANYMSRNADFTGLADSNQGLLSFWIKLASGNSTTQKIFVEGNGHFEIYRGSDNWLYIRGYNSAGTRILDVEYSSPNLFVAGMPWTHVCLSWNSAGAWLQVNGSTVNGTVFAFPSSGNVNLSGGGQWWFGADAVNSHLLNGCVSEFWFNPEYQATNIVDAFRDSGTGNPRDLGANGSLPTGSQPVIYLKNPFDSFGVNSGSGGSFGTSGGAFSSCTAPSSSGANTPPTISSIANQSTTANQGVGPLSFTVGDSQTAAGSLVVSGSSSNPTLVPNGNIGFGGSGSARTVSITPASGQTGTATITLTVSDGQLSSSTSFVISVSAAISTQDTTPPTVSVVAPTAGATVSGSSVTISASAADPTVSGQASTGVAGVQFKLDGQNLGSEVITAPYSMIWDTTKTANGSHSLSAAARDAAGNVGSSASVPVTLSNGGTRNYSTSFPVSEYPISEGGNWVNGGTTGIDWNDVRTANHVAFGPNGYNYADSTALLTGTWGPNQTVSATTFITDQRSSIYPEIELRLRSSLSPHVCTGYEINYSCMTNGNYISVVRWNGALGDFTSLAGVSGPAYVLTSGCTLKASIIDNHITVYLNSAIVLSVDDSTWTSGNPGMGFDQSGSQNGFSSFSATADSTGTSDSSAPSTPAGVSATTTSASSIHLSWNPSTDNIGVAGYRIYRAGTQLGTAVSTSYSDTGLVPSTTYSYTVAAYDAAGNVSAQSQSASATTAAQTAQSWAHVQSNAKNSGASTNGLSFANTKAGDLIIVEVDWSNGSTFGSLTDDQGNVYTQIGNEQNSSSVQVKSRLFYAKNIKGGTVTITTSVSGNPLFHELYIHEYSGLSTTNPLDSYSVNVGNSSSFSSKNLTTSAGNELLYGIEIDSGSARASAGWVPRSSLDSNVAADKNQSAAGAVAFTGSSTGSFIAWVAAFK